MSVLTRAFRNAKDSLESAQSIISRFSDNPTLSINDLHGLRAAANQARQATKELDMLCGMLEMKADT